MASDPVAMSAALKFLATKERFEAELRNHLADFEPIAVNEIVESLKRRNILNEERTFQSYLSARSGRKSIGTFRLEYELRRRGAPEEFLARISEVISEPDTALAALSGKFKPESALKQKGYRFLISRGFSYESASNAVRKFFDGDV